MTWRDDIDKAEKRILKIVNIPVQKEENEARKRIREVLVDLWKDAREFDSSWDSDF